MPHDIQTTEGRGDMSPAELLMVTEALGWSRADTCRVLDVKDRTLRWWMEEDGRIPDGVRDEIQEAEDFTAGEVDALVKQLRAQDSPVVDLYRGDRDMWSARPDYAPYPARWWRVVAYRACEQVDGVDVRWVADL